MGQAGLMACHHLQHSHSDELNVLCSHIYELMQFLTTLGSRNSAFPLTDDESEVQQPWLQVTDK
jgi:hypothetical protein